MSMGAQPAAAENRADGQEMTDCTATPRWIRNIVPSHGLLWRLNCIYKRNRGGQGGGVGVGGDELCQQQVINFSSFLFGTVYVYLLSHCQMFSSLEVYVSTLLLVR